MTADDADSRIHQMERKIQNDTDCKLFGEVGLRLIGIAEKKIQAYDVTQKEIKGRILQKSGELIRRGGNDSR